METPQSCYVSRFKICGLWGHRNLTLTFEKDSNILIGRNATGKTSVISILRNLLTLDIIPLVQVPFQEAEITLTAYNSAKTHIVTATVRRDALIVKLDDAVTELELPAYLQDPSVTNIPKEIIEQQLYRFRRNRISPNLSELRKRLNSIVPLVWLPLNRGLHNSFEDEARGERTKVNSVEDRLTVLLEELEKFRVRLDARLSQRYKEFERRVLELILFDKRHDSWNSLSQAEEFPIDEDRQQLLNAFREADLFDSSVQSKIDEHFSAQSEVVKRFKNRKPENRNEIELKDIFIMPLIRRTKEMVRHARQLDAEKQQIFSGMKLYIGIVAEFLSDKRIEVTEKGALKVFFLDSPDRQVATKHLSSGEKQILTLLTQALVYEDQPVVYIADEPELSLHVTWQERLLDALRALNKNMQIIVATHSPDIVGDRSVLDLAKALK